MTHRLPFAAFWRAAVAIALPVLAAACAAPTEIDVSRRLAAEGRHAEAVRMLEDGTRRRPADAILRIELVRQREVAVAELAEQFAAELRDERFEAAQATLSAIRALDADGPRLATLVETIANARRHAVALNAIGPVVDVAAAQRAERVARAVLAEDPFHRRARAVLSDALRLIATLPPPETRADAKGDTAAAALQRRVTLEFRDATLRNVFESLTRTANLNFVLDRDVRADTRVNLFLRDTSIDEAVRVLLQSQSLDMRRLNDTTYIVFPNTQQKTREYVPLEARTFFLSNVEAKQAQALVRGVVKSRDIFVDDRLNMLVIKDTPEAIRLAAQLIQSIDVPEPEVLLEVEILEINRARLTELGVRFPQQISYGLLGPLGSTGTGTGTTGTGGQAALGGVVTGATLDQARAFTANPLLVATLRGTDGTVNLLSNPRIRVRNRDKARVQLGEKVPVFTTNFTGAAGVGGAFSASVSYLDVGLTLNVEPVIHLENEVGIKVQLEVSAITERVDGPQGSTAFRIGTRNAQTSLRLRDGETQILAGLIRDEERRTAQRVPGVGDLPMVGRLFRSQADESSRTEIVLMITPRIVRGIDRVFPGSSRAVAAGTEAAVGVEPVRLSAAGRVSIATAAGAAAAARPAEPVAAPPAPAALAPPTPPLDGLRASLAVPAAVRAGQDFVIQVALDGLPGDVPAEAEVLYDTGAFLLPGGLSAGDGRAVVPLVPSGNRASGTLSLRASPGGARSGQVSIGTVRLTGPDAPSASVATGAPASVVINP